MSKSFLHTGTWLLGLGFLLTACHESPDVAAPQELPPVIVSVQTVSETDTVRVETLPGTVVPRSRALIESKVTGRILELNAEPGQQVKYGDLLVRLHAPEISASVDQAAAALTLAQNNEARIRRLFDRQAATRAELDVVESKLDQAKAAVAEAESMLAYTMIRAPFDGVVSGKFVDAGDFSTPGRRLVEIEVPAGQQLEASVSERLIDRIQLGDQHVVQFPDRNESVSAELVEINPAGAQRSRTWTVKWNLPDEFNIRSGAYGRVLIPSGEGRSISIPSSALIVRGQLEQVFVVVDGRSVLRLIKTGLKGSDTVEVISGLVGGELLIIDPTDELMDGQPIKF